MSTHYGRMIHEDDRTIMFANPEDAAEPTSASTSPRHEELGAFALPRAQTDPRMPKPRRSTVYEKDGEKYFVVDSHMHFWDASPANWVAGQENYAKGWIECFHAYQGLGPPETHWSIEHFQKYSEDDLMKDVFEDGYVDVAIFQPTYLKEWYTEGFNTTERNGALAREAPRQVHRQHPLRPARRRRRRSQRARGQRRPLGLQGRQALHGGVAATARAAGRSRTPEAYRYLAKAPGARHQEHPRAQGPDDLAAGQGRVRRRPTSTTRRPTSRS